MAIKWVQPNGSNGNSGDGPAPGDAWATIAYGVTQLNAADTLLVAPGTYIDSNQITKSLTANLTIYADINATYFSGYASAGLVKAQWTGGSSNTYAMDFERCNNLDVRNFTIIGTTSGLHIEFSSIQNTASINGITCQVSGNYGYTLGDTVFPGTLTVVNCSSTGSVTYDAMRVGLAGTFTITGGTLSNFGNNGLYKLISGTSIIRQVTVEGGEVGILLTDDASVGTIENCLITDFSDYGLYLAGTITAWYNTVVAGSGGFGAAFKEWGAAANAFTIRDNILIADDDTFGAITINSFGSLVDSDYNDLYNRDPSGPVGHANSTGYATLNDWQVASGDDANSISQEPTFVREDSNDYHLLTGSPCLNVAGDDPPVGPSVDLEDDTRPQAGTSDMGCYEGAEARGPLYVRADGDDANSGLGPAAEDALATLGRSLEICYNGDTIYVAPGTYSETAKSNLYVDNSNLTIVGDVTGSQFSDISAGLILTDRGSKSAYLEFRTANSLANPTIVSGLWPKTTTPTSFTAFLIKNGATYVILQDIDATEVPTINSMPRSFVQTESGSSNITIKRCKVMRVNGGTKEGSSIRLVGGATVDIENCLLTQASGIATGGIYVTSGFSGGVNIYNCDIFSPSGVAGRCLYVAAPNVNLKNCILIANMNDPAQSVILEVTAAATATFTSDYNDLLQRGSGSFGVWGGSVSTNLAGWQSDSSQDSNSISLEPLFSHEAAPEDEGLSIGIDSPCRDTGTSDGGNAPTEDILQFGRPSGSDYDMGAYEYPSSIAVVITKTSRR